MCSLHMFLQCNIDIVEICMLLVFPYKTESVISALREKRTFNFEAFVTKICSLGQSFISWTSPSSSSNLHEGLTGKFVNIQQSYHNTWYIQLWEQRKQPGYSRYDIKENYSNSSHGKLKERTLKKKLHFPRARPHPSPQSGINIFKTLLPNPILDYGIYEYFLT